MATIIYIANDHLLELSDLKNVATGEFINDATVTATIKSAGGAPIAGESWPVTMAYVAGSNGLYRATIDEEIVITERDYYEAEVEAVAAGDLKGSWELELKAAVRGAS